MTILQLPSEQSIDYAVSSLSCTATPAEQRALLRAQYQIHKGLEICAVTGGFLVPSASGATPHRIDNVFGCDCPAGRAHRICWHASALLIVEEARNARPRMTKTRAEAAAEMEETTSDVPANWPRDFATGKPMDWYAARDRSERQVPHRRTSTADITKALALAAAGQSGWDDVATRQATAQHDIDECFK